MEISVTTMALIGVAALIIEGVGVYLIVMGRVDERFNQYVRKGEQDIVNARVNQDIVEIKGAINKIGEKVEGMVRDVPGIIVRAIRQEFKEGR